MKHFALSLVALLSCSSVAIAQDDVYFVPSKKSAQHQNTRNTISRVTQQETFEYDNWAEHRYSGRDIDDYNRRNAQKRQEQIDTLQNDSEQSMTARIVRFRSPRGVLVASPWYDTYYYDLAYYDPWFCTWGWSSWYGYYDPWLSPWSWSRWHSPWYYNGWYNPWSWSYGWYSPYYYGGYGHWGWGHWYGYNNPWHYGWGSYPYWYEPTPRNHTLYGQARGSNTPRQAFGGRGNSFGSRNAGGSYNSRGSSFGSRGGSTYDLRSGRGSSSSNRYEGRSGSSFTPSRSGVIGGSRGGTNSYNAPSRSSSSSSEFRSSPSSSFSAPSRSGSSFNSGGRSGFGGSGSSSPSRSGVVGGRR